MKRFFIIPFLLAPNFWVHAQISIDTLGSLPEVANESSGIIRASDGNFWTFNDSGNEPLLFHISESGKLLRTVQLHVKNKDWEAITRDDDGYIYVGDIGNNKNKRKSLTIYRIKEDDLFGKGEIPVTEIQFYYPEQSTFPPEKNQRHYDAEALIWLEGKLVIFTKNRTEPFDGFSRVYSVNPEKTGLQPAILIDSLHTGQGIRQLNWVTDAAISPNKNVIALLSSSKFWLLFDAKPQDFSGGRWVEVPLGGISQKEGICFVDDSTLIMTEERNALSPGGIYKIDIGPHLHRHKKIRKHEVTVFPPQFADTLEVKMELEVSGMVLYELFTSEGERKHSGKLGFKGKGTHTENLIFPELKNGTYILNIIVRDRPHGFILKRYAKPDPEKLLRELKERK